MSHGPHRPIAPETQRIAIIGAGIGGLSVAHRLLQTGYRGRISIYEKASSAGGRLMSQRVDDGALVVELGAGRLHARRHSRVHALCQALDIPLVPFDYPAHYRPRHQAPELARRWLGTAMDALRRARHDPRRPRRFSEFCREVVGDDMAQQLRIGCGYDSLLHPHLPVEAGLSILQDHPETESLFGGQCARWLCVRDGLQALAHAMQRDLGDRVDMHFGAQLQGIEPSPDGAGGYRLRLAGERGAFRDRADVVIVAALPQDAHTIRGWPESQAHSAKDAREEAQGQAHDSLDGIALLKGYVQFEQPWWNTAYPSSTCVIADSPLRKLYLTAGSRTLWFYCDGPSATSLAAILDGHGGGLPPEMIEQHLGCRMPAGTAAEHCRWKFWERGVGFYRDAPPGPSAGRGFMAVAPDLLLCSDIFTDHVGWVEGSLISAYAAVDHLHRALEASDTTMALAA